ncbi:MAG: undecaprenyl-diphosphate phosphatase [Proteobacteria bacterium]|nr:undecaprenyl-diphosphate phosphatase [Pseudomonadota bacterium]
MTWLQALWMAILQGVTELFPISSLGHAVLVPALLDWHVNQQAPEFLPFLVVLHLGTAAALLLYFWRDWWVLAKSALGQGPAESVSENRRLLGLIVVATFPAAILGFAFEKGLQHLFGSPLIAAAFLLVNGLVLFAAERLKPRGGGLLTDLTWTGALIVGLFQCAALVPGISRSGATMVGGLLLGLHHKDAARFSFLIAAPIIGGAGLFEVPKLLSHGSGSFGSTIWFGGMTAAVTAYASTAFLMRYFSRHDFDALDPFAYYCWAAGTLSLAWLLL